MRVHTRNVPARYAVPMRMCAALALFILAACGGAAAQVQVQVQHYRSACVRDLQQFIYELSSAIEANDVNRLAALYRWQGTSSRSGYDLMRRLGGIAARPLLQVAPVFQEPPGSPRDDLLAPLPPRGQAPVALRLDQTLADGVTPAGTVLRLQRDLGCWWVTL